MAALLFHFHASGGLIHQTSPQAKEVVRMVVILQSRHIIPIQHTTHLLRKHIKNKLSNSESQTVRSEHGSSAEM